MVVRFLRNIQTMLFIISCRSIQSISLKVIPVFAVKYSKYFPPSYSGICRCFATICWARTSAWASQSSGSHIRWWFISQTSPFSSTFYINQLFRFILHFTSFNIFVRHHWPNLARSILQHVDDTKRVIPTLFMDSLINFASKISDVTALPPTQRFISLICLWTKCNYKFFRHLPRSPKKWDVSADTKGNPSCHS